MQQGYTQLRVKRRRILDTKISVDGNVRLGKVSPYIFGTMLENWGVQGRHVIYGSVWVGEESPTPNLRGLRKDVVEATREMSPTIIRWPGGCPADAYHWLDGVGPRDKRPWSLLSANWSKNVEETNQFGTSEFVDFCHQVTAEPYINVNVGTGTPEEAANWVEYCNREGRTKYSLMRMQYGHPQPFNVKFWGIGNELYGDWEIGHVNAQDHARIVFEYSKLMRMADPAIKIIAVGCDQDDWNYPLLKEADNLIDYISIHKYYTYEDYYTLVACPLDAENSFKRMTSLINAATPKLKMTLQLRKIEKIKIAVDEWNVWHREANPPESPILAGYQKLTLQDGLFAAGMFHVMADPRNGVGMANLCNLSNSGPSGPITTNEQTVYVNPQYLAFRLYRHHTGDTVLSSTTEVDTYEASHVDLTSMVMGEGIGDIMTGGPKKNRVPYLDCLATLDEEKAKLYLAVINRHKDQDMECAIDLQGLRVVGRGKVYVLNGESEISANDFDIPNNVGITEKQLDSVTTHFSYVFPCHSVTLLELITR